MSSAAIGLLSSPYLSAAVNASKKDVEKSYDMGVCSGAMHHCADGNIRVLDGCYADNMAVGMMLGRLIEKYPGDETLKIFAIDSDVCVEGKAGGLNCSLGISGNVQKLFAGAGNPATIAIRNYPDVPTVNHQVFSENLSLPEASCGSIENSNMRYLAGTFTTVENPYYGVTGGRKVALVVLNLHTLLDDIPDLAKPWQTRQYGELAEATYQAGMYLRDKFVRSTSFTPCYGR